MNTTLDLAVVWRDGKLARNVKEENGKEIGLSKDPLTNVRQVSRMLLSSRTLLMTRTPEPSSILNTDIAETCYTIAMLHSEPDLDRSECARYDRVPR